VLAGAGQFGRPDQGIFSYWIHAYLRRMPLRYTGFGGSGYQVRDVLHPRDVVPLLLKQMSAVSPQARSKVINLGGGQGNAISLAEMTEWCRSRFGFHPIASDPQSRFFDVPWMVMDYSLAKQMWGWKPETSLNHILEEIAEHAEKNPHWLQISGAL
jgi:CDP-paratose 2-epimerase